MRAVLYVDDSEAELQALRLSLSSSYCVHTCRSGKEAVDMVRSLQPSAVILDLALPHSSGLKILDEIRSLPHPPPVMMLSGYNEPHLVIRAMKAGASDYIFKPCAPTLVERHLSRIIDSASRAAGAEDSQDSRTHYRPILGSSPLMQDFRRELDCFSLCALPVLILGESGTGKDLAARYLHNHSEHCYGPFEPRNIGACTDSLIESELFGCEPGAFTGASLRKGWFEEANGGTLFLDEMGDASPSCQAALLRVLEDQSVRRMGSPVLHHVTFRLITATNKDLGQLIAEGRFRSDLYFRIESLTLRIPPLRSHSEDIPELAAAFIQEKGGVGDLISEEAMAVLLACPWPGNIRQLHSALERAWVLSRGGRMMATHFAGLATGFGATPPLQ